MPIVRIRRGTMVAVAAAVAAVAVVAVVAAILLRLAPRRVFKKKKKREREAEGTGGTGGTGEKPGRKKKGELDPAKETTIGIKQGTGSGRKKSFSATQKLDLKGSDTAKASFDVAFDDGFEWGCNGKVGGLFIGGGKASGGKNSNDGASVRFNWTEGGGAFAYVYAPKGTGAQQKGAMQKEKKVKLFKDEMRGVLAGDGYHNVELDVKLNSFNGGRANNDGTLTMSVKDSAGRVRKATQDGIVWRKNANVGFDRLRIQPFHGGGAGKCKAATRDSTIRIKNTKVQKK